MNKILILLLVALFVSFSFAQNSFLNQRYLVDSGEDSGEDCGEDGGEDNGEDCGEDNGEINGDWNNNTNSDQGELTDSGDFNGSAQLYDNGEVKIYVKFNRHKLEQVKGSLYSESISDDSGEFTHIYMRENGKTGKITKEEVNPLIIKKLKQSGENHHVYDNTYQDNGEDPYQISGEWNNVINDDNGELVDHGEYNGIAEEQDNGEFKITVNFDRHKLEQPKGQAILKTVNDNNGKFTHVGIRQKGKSGKITKDEVIPIILNKLKQSEDKVEVDLQKSSAAQRSMEIIFLILAIIMF